MLLEVQGLTVGYGKNPPVLKDLSFSLDEGEVVGLLGINGAGKTTLLHTLAGLIPNYQVERITWQGRTLKSFRDVELITQRHLLFTEGVYFRNFVFDEYLAFVASCYHQSVPDVTELVEGFDFEPHRKTLFSKLSTGNLKKAFLIALFALKPKLALLDEPINGIDFRSTEYLYQLLKDGATGGAVFFSSHVLESLSLTAHRVLALSDGRIAHTFAGGEIDRQKVAQLLKDEEHEAL